MEKVSILIADDEPRIRKLVSDFFVREGYDTIAVANGREGYEALLAGQEKIKLIILDIMMPEMTGFQLLEKIRAFSAVPVIMLTARGEEADQLMGFKLGADDYVSKPFSPSVLVARAKRILNKSSDAYTGKLVEGDVVVDISAHTVSIGDERLALTLKEFELLLYFINNKQLALSRDMILNAVWNYDYYGDLRTVDTHVKQLRAKLGEAGTYIQTVRGIGYRFEVST